MKMTTDSLVVIYTLDTVFDRIDGGKVTYNSIQQNVTVFTQN